MFIAGFTEAEIVGTHSKLDDPKAPVWSSVHLTTIEALGGGTIAYDEAEGHGPYDEPPRWRPLDDGMTPPFLINGR